MSQRWAKTEIDTLTSTCKKCCREKGCPGWEVLNCKNGYWVAYPDEVTISRELMEEIRVGLENLIKYNTDKKYEFQDLLAKLPPKPEKVLTFGDLKQGECFRMNIDIVYRKLKRGVCRVEGSITNTYLDDSIKVIRVRATYEDVPDED